MSTHRNRTTRESRSSRPPRLDKRLGQHHLLAPELSEPMLAWLRPAGCLVVEVGPGGGALTGRLGRNSTRVLGLEVDLRWAAEVRRTVPSASIVAVDAMHFDWSRVPADTVVVGNLPYNISTALVERMLDAMAAGVGLGFLVQLEVAERIEAKPGVPAYGSFSVIAQSRSQWRRFNRVKPGSFRPPPKVHSAFVAARVERELSEIADWFAYKEFVRACFARRRKTLLNSLRSASPWAERAGITDLAEQTASALREFGRAPSARPGELSVDEYLQLWQRLAANRS